MPKMLLVLRHELFTTLARPSFFLIAIGLPLLSILGLTGVEMLSKGQAHVPTTMEQLAAVIEGDEPSGPLPEGYVDESGLIRTTPEALISATLQAYHNQLAARQALEAGEIGAYYIVPQNYLSSGEVIYIQAKYNPLAMKISIHPALKRLLLFNLANGNVGLFRRIERPMLLQTTVLEPIAERDIGDPMSLVQPYGIALLYCLLIFSSSSLMVNAINKEKSNRVMENLLASVTPLQLFVGKIAGLGIAGLLQTAVWTGSVYAFSKQGANVLGNMQGYPLSLAFIGWGIAFFILGYLLYGSLLAGLGALATNLREVSQFTMLLIAPLMAPALMTFAFARAPNGSLVTALSLFPLTAPSAMMARMAASNHVPTWHIVLAIVFLVVSVIFAIYGAARLFHTQVLLSGEALNTRRLLKALTGQL